MHPGIPAIFIVLDSEPEKKSMTLTNMAKLKENGVNLFSIVISDSKDLETKSFFEEFCGSKDNIY